jgi:hypothetical protein
VKKDNSKNVAESERSEKMSCSYAKNKSNELLKSVKDILMDKVTSASSPIMDIFLNLNLPHKENSCLYYQGSGCDITTILLNNVHCQIFSDIGPTNLWVDNIKDKLEKLCSINFIKNLENSKNYSTFKFFTNNQKWVNRSFFYTQRTIEDIEFPTDFNSDLFCVYEKNAGTATDLPIFWSNIKEKLLPNGYVLGVPGSNSPPWNLIELDGNNFFLLNGTEEIPLDTIEKISFLKKLKDRGKQIFESIDGKKIITHKGQIYQYNHNEIDPEIEKRHFISLKDLSLVVVKNENQALEIYRKENS